MKFSTCTNIYVMSKQLCSNRQCINVSKFDLVFYEFLLLGGPNVEISMSSSERRVSKRGKERGREMVCMCGGGRSREWGGGFGGSMRRDAHSCRGVSSQQRARSLPPSGSPRGALDTVWVELCERLEHLCLVQCLRDWLVFCAQRQEGRFQATGTPIGGGGGGGYYTINHIFSMIHSHNKSSLSLGFKN